ncbi:hypothetical protein [Roseobacter sp. SK209-2-6]|uniref:hypothetical protein n=1 Tax=Roseobacter sp. SK209-2-6 TaxID=388739 RepID=UPI0012F492D8|nr:hypothetical protein [Roseobacter sp. SK209-2-6]
MGARSGAPSTMDVVVSVLTGVILDAVHGALGRMAVWAIVAAMILLYVGGGAFCGAAARS